MKTHIQGWNEFFQRQYEQLDEQMMDASLEIARVSGLEASVYSLVCENDHVEAVCSGRFQCHAEERSDYPVPGDWVLVRRGEGLHLIEHVFERKSRFQRQAAGKAFETQVVAANIDLMFITAALEGGRDFNERGIERYLLMVHDGGAKACIVLNKCDLCDESERREYLARARAVSGGAGCIMVSAHTGEGLGDIRSLLGDGVSAAFTGPSGVGKSALINALLEKDLQKTGYIRADDKRGRHTTTSRRMYPMESGAVIIDTPGLRELRPDVEIESLDRVFPEIAQAAGECRFSDCTHSGEPGCRVQQLLAQGTIDPDRYQNWQTLRKEIIDADMRKTQKGRAEKKARDKALALLVREYKKNKRK